MKELNNENFKDEINSGLAVVDFFAPWCGPCRMMGPVFEELSEEMQDVKFFKVNTEENNELARTYAVMSIPCFIVFKDGEEIDRIIGGMPKDVLKKRIEALK
ncbi:thioredoxin [Candidatus Woesearchaeota archaeon]|nr:thioredoxin [Candidatus Woesearchaeota archaeon]MBW3021973.1 thioredoxin [Candidatus Woesearchaeota archaeon]